MTAGAPLSSAEARLAAITRLSEAAHGSDLSTLLAAVAAETGSDRVAFFHLRSEDESLHVVSVWGYDGPLFDGLRRPTVPARLTAELVKSRAPRPVHIAEFPEERRALMLAEGFREGAVIPLWSVAGPVGSLNLARTTERPYTDDELAFAVAITAPLVPLLERLVQLGEADRKVRLLSLLNTLARLGAEGQGTEVLLRTTLEQALDALAVDSVMIHFLEGGRLRLTGNRRRTGPDETLTKGVADLPLDASTLSGRAALAGTVVRTDARQWPQSTAPLARANGARHGIAAPVSGKDGLIGTLCAIRTADVPFAADEAQLLGVAAAQLGVLLDQARLLEAERQRSRDLELINRVGALIAERIEVNAVLDDGVQQLARIADAESAVLFLLEGEDLVPRASSKPHPMLEGLRMGPRYTRTLTRRCIDERRPLVVNDVGTDAGVNRAVLVPLGVKAMAALPLISRGQVLGAATLLDMRDGRPFSAEAIERAQAVTNQLATAINNAQLLEDLQKRNAELAAAQSRLVQRERLAALGELAAVVAHEVRNPLAVIFNSLATLKRQPAGQLDGMLLGIVREEAERLDRMVNELLTFARPGDLALSRQPLPQVIASAAEGAMGALGARGRVQLDVTDGLPEVPLDRELLRQALVNLLVNALQAQPAGEVRVRAQPDAEAARRFVRIEVTDEGPGIPADAAGKIFEPFFTTKAQGTGLGLAIVRRIVEAHHGEISFVSAPGEGTTFRVRLPVE